MLLQLFLIEREWNSNLIELWDFKLLSDIGPLLDVEALIDVDLLPVSLPDELIIEAPNLQHDMLSLFFYPDGAGC